MSPKIPKISFDKFLNIWDKENFEESDWKNLLQELNYFSNKLQGIRDGTVPDQRYTHKTHADAYNKAVKLIQQNLTFCFGILHARISNKLNTEKTAAVKKPTTSTLNVIAATAPITASAAVLTTPQLPVTQKTEDNKHVVSTNSDNAAQVTEAALPAVSKTAQLSDNKKVEDNKQTTKQVIKDIAADKNPAVPTEPAAATEATVTITAPLVPVSVASQLPVTKKNKSKKNKHKKTVTNMAADNKHTVATNSVTAVQTTTPIGTLSAAISATLPLEDSKTINNKPVLSATTDTKISTTPSSSTAAVKKSTATDKVIEIQYNTYYRYIYSLIGPIGNAGMNYDEPDQLVVLKKLINFYRKNTGNSTASDLEIAKQLEKILNADLTKLDPEEKFDHSVTQCNQVINNFNFDDCKQMLLVFAAYYSFFPDKIPYKIALNSQIINLLNPFAWAEEVYNSSPHDNNYVQCFLSKIKLYEHSDQPFSDINQFDPNLIVPDVFLHMPVSVRLKLIADLMRNYLVIKKPYTSKNWCIFFALSRFFKFIPAPERTKILSAAIEQFKS